MKNKKYLLKISLVFVEEKKGNLWKICIFGWSFNPPGLKFPYWNVLTLHTNYA